LKGFISGMLLAAALLGLCRAWAGSHPADSVKYSFVFVGCNRL
jgi:hypothetical protein